MTKIDIVSGFLGAGKTTLIKKLLDDALKGQKIVLIENEFGEIGIDGGFLKDAGIDIREMNSGCICCSLVGDFGKALQEVLSQFAPDRIIIEPSGVGKLSDVIKAVLDVTADKDIELASYTAVADVTKCKMYMKNFGEFYNNQIESAKTIVLSRTQKVEPEKLDAAVALIREKNSEATIVTTPWDELTGAQLLKAMEEKSDFADRLLEEIEAMEIEEHDHDHEHHHEHDHEHEHHHHDHDHEEHDHDHDHEEHDHDHEHHHDHDHDHEHHHHDGGTCSCGCHHDHHGHHHADDVFISWGKETHQKYTKEEIAEILRIMADGSYYGVVLRAKGIVAAQDGTWIHFDMVPEETEIRTGEADVTGRLCVIGTLLHTDRIEEAFRV
ncbi:MAG: GTP-binding protein [Lachnospiraceae bacterium]|nr:GTP-binding protein [Lachnospiraceae bacterium]